MEKILILHNGHVVNLINIDYKLIVDGENVLDGYKVRNAIILAAGMTSDNNPIARNMAHKKIVVKK